MDAPKTLAVSAARWTANHSLAPRGPNRRATFCNGRRPRSLPISAAGRARVKHLLALRVAVLSK
jgi:hypothetical protein